MNSMLSGGRGRRTGSPEPKQMLSNGSLETETRGAGHTEKRETFCGSKPEETPFAWTLTPVRLYME